MHIIRGRVLIGATTVALLTLTGLACGRGDGSRGAETADADTMRELAMKSIVLRVPDVCLEGDNPTGCETWLGIRDGMIGTTHVDERVAFSIEDVTDDGRFHLAVFPDCGVEARAAAELAATTPDNAAVVEIGAETTSRDFEDTENPEAMLSGGAIEVAPTADDDPTRGQPAVLESSPLAHCRRLMAPASEVGAPVSLIEPTAANEDAWWTLHFPTEGHPIFVSTKPCNERIGCKIRLLLREDGLLSATYAKDDALMLRSFWNKITGSVSKGFDSIETGVADIKKQVGTAVDVKAIGGKKLFVAAALPAARLYSAVKEQGPEALALADGTVKDGSMYIKVGGKYVEHGGTAAIQGVKYIAEYIQANVCYLGVMTELVAVFGSSAATYEVGLATGFTEFFNKHAGAMTLENMYSDKSSPTYLQMLVFAKVYALHASAISGKFKPTQWETIVMDIILSAFAGNIKAGYTPIIMSKVARAMCKGTDEALSAAHALVSTSSTTKLPDDCLQGIRDRANARFEAGEDLCYSATAEIKTATIVPPANARVSRTFETTTSCPKDPLDDAYYNLLEGIGCVKKKVSMDQVAELSEVTVDDATILTHDRYWTRTSDWLASLKCNAGAVAVGMCASGGALDCFGQAKELLCASRTDKPIVNEAVGRNRTGRDLSSGWNVGMTFCPNGMAMTQFCSSGANLDCDGKNFVARCEKISSAFAVDYGRCDHKESKAWTGRLEATAPNHVMVGACASGKNPDCGEDSDVTKAAMFCPLVLAEEDDGILQVFHFKKDTAHLLLTQLGENRVGWHYKGVAFSLYEAAGEGREPLYSCSNPTETFVWTSANCKGGVSHGVMGYMPTAANGKPIHRCLDGQGRHMFTTDRAACEADGYVVDGEVGYSL